jgi:hypothetical protein
MWDSVRKLAAPLRLCRRRRVRRDRRRDRLPTGAASGRPAAPLRLSSPATCPEGPPSGAAAGVGRIRKTGEAAAAMSPAPCPERPLSAPAADAGSVRKTGGAAAAARGGGSGRDDHRPRPRAGREDRRRRRDGRGRRCGCEGGGSGGDDHRPRPAPGGRTGADAGTAAAAAGRRVSRFR